MNWMTSAKKRVGKTRKVSKKDMLRSKAFEKLNKTIKKEKLREIPSAMFSNEYDNRQSYDSFKYSTDAIMIGNFQSSNKTHDYFQPQTTMPREGGHAQNLPQVNIAKYDPLNSLSLSDDDQDLDRNQALFVSIGPSTSRPHTPAPLQKRNAELEQQREYEAVSKVSHYIDVNYDRSKESAVRAPDQVHSWGLFHGDQRVFQTSSAAASGTAPIPQNDEDDLETSDFV